MRFRRPSLEKLLYLLLINQLYLGQHNYTHSGHEEVLIKSETALFFLKILCHNWQTELGNLNVKSLKNDLEICFNASKKFGYIKSNMFYFMYGLAVTMTNNKIAKKVKNYQKATVQKKNSVSDSRFRTHSPEF